jgi:uncharacterized membrane protein
MQQKAAITVYRSREDVETLWHSPDYRPQYIDERDAAVTFMKAPGDRGTEIHVDLGKSTPGGTLAEALKKLAGSAALAKVKDDLRRFKQHVETGEVARSESTPQGESAERKLKQRPAQPLPESELEKAGT